MNKSIIAAVSLCLGGIAGFFVARKVFEQKYKLLADEEIASVKRAFRKGEKKPPSDGGILAQGKDAQTLANEFIDKLHYAKDPEVPEASEPRVITPDEFNSIPEYDEVSLTYYSDGVVADENGHALSEDEVQRSIGGDPVSHFGEYEEDSVFIRNDAYKTDYEILYDHRTYAQVLEEKPYLES